MLVTKRLLKWHVHQATQWTSALTGPGKHFIVVVFFPLSLDEIVTEITIRSRENTFLYVLPIFAVLVHFFRKHGFYKYMLFLTIDMFLGP